MKKVYIIKSEIITGVGNSLLESWEKIYSAETGIRKIDLFNTETIDYKYASIINVTAKNKNLKLMKNVLKLIGYIPDNTFVIWTGIKGNAEAIENNSKELILPVYYRKKVCDILNIRNIGMEINAACASSTVGIIYGSELISAGIYKSVLVCASDTVSRFTHMGFSSLKALSKTAAKPFDINRDGLNLGDGACAVLLSDKKTAIKMDKKTPFFISGWGISNDANHITGPDKYASGLKDAINKTLNRAGKKPGEIEAYCTHGTGTVFNDAMELTAIEKIFTDKLFPCFSVKGSIGHTLGAAGGIETALCTICLREQKILPTKGLVNHEERAKGRFLKESQTFKGNNILTTNSGFGGVNASLLLERES